MPSASKFLLTRIRLKKQNKHIILFPFSLLYGLVTGVRNWMFDRGMLKSTTFDFPLICIGNLAVGGTGKTPHTEFILSALQSEWKSAMLSRGYKRKTKGFYLADENSDSLTLGDEPYQIHQKFPAVKVAVDEKRVRGVNKLQSLFPDLQVIVLDDAFQHRYIETGFSILLTDFANLYSRDMLLPAGSLRETKSGSKRANIIVVTKCPIDLSPIDMRLIEMELKPATNQMLFFSSYVYDELVPVFPESVKKIWTYDQLKESKAGVLLVAGIVSPEPIVKELSKYTDTIETLFYADHHAFQARDFTQISTQFDKIITSEKIILVTEKDAARLLSSSILPEALKAHIYALPIRVEILLDQEILFIQKIKSYVVEDSRNC